MSTSALDPFKLIRSVVIYAQQLQQTGTLSFYANQLEHHKSRQQALLFNYHTQNLNNKPVMLTTTQSFRKEIQQNGFSV